MSLLSLERANASVRNGARQSQVVTILLVPIGVAYILSHRLPFAWPLVSLLVILGLLIIADAHRFSTLTFTPHGIEGGNLTSPVLWHTIIAANYSRDFVLRLEDQSGRVAFVRYLFAASAKDIRTAVSEHLPPGITISWGFQPRGRDTPSGDR